MTPVVSVAVRLGAAKNTSILLRKKSDMSLNKATQKKWKEKAFDFMRARSWIALFERHNRRGEMCQIGVGLLLAPRRPSQIRLDRTKEGELGAETSVTDARCRSIWMLREIRDIDPARSTTSAILTPTDQPHP
jgi:hypothetical protein